MTTYIVPATTLGDLSKSLQELHQHLLMYQADEVFFTGSPLQLFEIASKDSSFAWLAPLRQAITELDERRSDPELLSKKEVRALGERMDGFLQAKSGPFRDKLNTVFQTHPEAVWAVGAARKALAALT